VFDTLNNAIRAAEGFLEQVKNPRIPGSGAPVRHRDWLRWHRSMVAQADGSRARLQSSILQGSPEEIAQARALQEELLAVAQPSAAEAIKHLCGRNDARRSGGLISANNLHASRRWREYTIEPCGHCDEQNLGRMAGVHGPAARPQPGWRPLSD
jgi:hypothetical protein